VKVVNTIVVIAAAAVLVVALGIGVMFLLNRNKASSDTGSAASRAPAVAAAASPAEPATPTLAVTHEELVLSGAKLLNETPTSVEVEFVKPESFLHFVVEEAEAGKTYTWKVSLRTPEGVGPAVTGLNWFDGQHNRQPVSIGPDWTDFDIVAEPRIAKLNFYIDNREEGSTATRLEVRLGVVEVKAN
jgi:hypothetical protein